MPSRCRACLGLSENMRYLPPETPESQYIIAMYTAVTNFEWISDEKAASCLCPECEEALEKCYSFQKKCKESHEVLLKEIEENLEETLDADVDTKQRRVKRRVKEFSVEEVQRAIYDYRQRQKDMVFKCIVCDYALETLRALSSHMSRVHKEMRNNWCHICNQFFDDLGKHQLGHKDSTEFCHFCNKNIKRRYFIEHLRMHSSDEFQPQCDKEVIEPRCEICTKVFKSEMGLKTHLKLHRGDTPHKCRYCDKPHKSRAQLMDHEHTHTGAKPYVCNICGKGFAQSGALNTHMKLHTGRPEVCDVCQKRFCRPSELKLHLRKHSGEKPFLCTECGKAFVQNSHLSDHMKTHSDLRPFKCLYCDKAFKQKSLLTSHLQIHSGYKPLKCEFCAYACFKPYRLQQHMKQHSSDVRKDKMFVCPVCEKGFTTQAMFNTHLTTSHNAIL